MREEQAAKPVCVSKQVTNVDNWIFIPPGNVQASIEYATQVIQLGTGELECLYINAQ